VRHSGGRARSTSPPSRSEHPADLRLLPLDRTVGTCPRSSTRRSAMAMRRPRGRRVRGRARRGIGACVPAVVCVVANCALSPAASPRGEALPTATSSSAGAGVRTTRSTRLRETPRATARGTCSMTRGCRPPTSRTGCSGTSGPALRTTHRVRRHGPTADTPSSTRPGTARRAPEPGRYSPDPRPTPCPSSSDTPNGPDSRHGHHERPRTVLPGEGAGRGGPGPQGVQDRETAGPMAGRAPTTPAAPSPAR
jgi:hypothetical protein